MTVPPQSGRRFEHVDRIGSTNAELLSRLAQGEQLRESDWLIAERQEAGRGRLGRVWQDGAGNFMGSTCVAIRAGDPPPHTLALVTGVAVHEAVAGLTGAGADLALKWPNDLLAKGAKLAGILLERQRDHVVIGLGVNLASAPDLPDRPSIALSALGHDVPRADLERALAASLDAEIALWRSAGLAQTVARWVARGPAPGTKIAVNPASEDRLTGDYRGLDPDGALLLRLAGGSVRAIHAGEVELLRNGEN